MISDFSVRKEPSTRLLESAGLFVELGWQSATERKYEQVVGWPFIIAGSLGILGAVLAATSRGRLRGRCENGDEGDETENGDAGKLG